MAEREVIAKTRARALLKCTYPTLQGYIDSGKLSPAGDDGKLLYLDEVEGLLEGEQETLSQADYFVRAMKGFEKHLEGIMKLAIEPVTITLKAWEKINEANEARSKSDNEENQRLRDKYHGVLIKLEEMLNGEHQRQLEEKVALAADARKDVALKFITEKAGPTLVSQLNRTIGLKTKAQPLLDLVERMSVDQIETLFSTGLIDKAQRDALYAIKGVVEPDGRRKKDDELPQQPSEASSSEGNG